MHLLTRLQIAKAGFEKKRNALLENFDLSAHINETTYPIVSEPFPHVVIDNFFTETTYQSLLNHFATVFKRGFADDDDEKRFHPFLDLKGKYAYDGYVHTPMIQDASVLSIFGSVAWNLLFSSLFEQPTGECTSFAYHFHPKNNRTGFVHNDFALRKFSIQDKLNNGIIPRSRTHDDASLFLARRIIALIFYLGNEGWKDGDGGETGLYVSKDGAPAVRIAPKSNRLLAFQISPTSFHAFQQNSVNRSSIVQWFHADDSWLPHKHLLGERVETTQD